MTPFFDGWQDRSLIPSKWQRHSSWISEPDRRQAHGVSVKSCDHLQNWKRLGVQHLAIWIVLQDQFFAPQNNWKPDSQDAFCWQLKHLLRVVSPEAAPMRHQWSVPGGAKRGYALVQSGKVRAEFVFEWD